MPSNPSIVILNGVFIGSVSVVCLCCWSFCEPILHNVFLSIPDQPVSHTCDNVGEQRKHYNSDPKLRSCIHYTWVCSVIEVHSKDGLAILVNAKELELGHTVTK